MNYIPILSALIPALVLLVYIYWRDRKSPEPIWQLIKATALGVLSIPLTYILLGPLISMDLIPNEAYTFVDAIKISFLGAAIPEELAKLLILWIFLHRNPHFDERMDGIVYAVCVSLGFAGLENIMYIINDTEWMSVALKRAFTAVPGHFCFGVVMGYFYSLAKFNPTKRHAYSILTLIMPILIHGIYDTIIYSINIDIRFDTILMTAFVAFCFLMWNWASKSIQKHLHNT